MLFRVRPGSAWRGVLAGAITLGLAWQLAFAQDSLGAGDRQGLTASVAHREDPRRSLPEGPSHVRLAAHVGTATTIPALIRALRDPDPGVRRSAAAALGGFGANARSAVPALVEALGDHEAGVRAIVAATLGEIGPVAGAKVLPGLVRALRDRAADVRASAARAIARFEPAGREAVPVPS